MPETTTNVELTLDLWLLARVKAWAEKNKMTIDQAVSFLLERLNQPATA